MAVFRHALQCRFGSALTARMPRPQPRGPQFAHDSLLEESGFEPSVPAATEGAPLGTKVGFALDPLLEESRFETSVPFRAQRDPPCS